MSHLLVKASALASPHGKKRKSNTHTVTSSDQESRETKSAPYKDKRYETLLTTKDSYMDEHNLSITDKAMDLCQSLLEKEQTVPQVSLFRDDLFEETCRRIRNKTESRIVRDISPLIAPSAETLAIYGATHLKVTCESVNEGWNNSIPVIHPRPEPDYSVGFRREAFTEAQLNTLQSRVGGVMNNSYCLGTYYMYFPFLTCEVKCGDVGLDIADRQNAHSMTLAVRGIVELFKLVRREKELHREILAFSISHNDESVRIYGHYPVIDGNKTAFYRHTIRKFNFTEMDGKEKWATYKFTKNVYDEWMPNHFKRICSVVDELQVPGSSGLSYEVQSHSSPVDSPDTTANTSVSQGTKRGILQRLRLKPPRPPP
jgi:hypothetical protein